MDTTIRRVVYSIPLVLSIEASSMEFKDDRDLLIRLLNAEAANQPPMGQAAIIHNILNRTNNKKYPNSINDVVMDPGDYSALNYITGYNKGVGGNKRGIEEISDKNYEKFGMLVDAVMSGLIPDPTKGALNYYNPSISSPSWGKQMGNKVKIGDHLFGSIIDKPPTNPRPRPDPGINFKPPLPRARPREKVPARPNRSPSVNNLLATILGGQP